MPFDNEDLKRLKESKHEDCEWVIPWDKFKALIVRIESAEEIIEQSGFLNEKCRKDHHGYCQTHFISKPCPVFAWRKAAGKDGV